jgi:hypothetical protein
MIILHPSEHHGEAFKLLGCPIDPDLRMESAVDHVLKQIRPKTTAILRTRGYYSIPALILQFKTFVWGLIECHLGTYFHAASTLLGKIDGVQRRFLREIDLTAKRVFIDHHFAPPSLRRNIAVLGLLHKRVLGKCNPSFAELFPWWSHRFSEARGIGHTKQLYGHWSDITNHRALYDRSIFAMVDV